MPYTIPSTRGGFKLVDDLNYMYRAHCKSEDRKKTYWKCDLSTCKARVHTNSDYSDIIINKMVHEHHHPATAAKALACKSIAKLKKAAQESKESSSSLVASCSSDLDEISRSELPSMATLSRNVRKWRQRLSKDAPPAPKKVDKPVPVSFKFLLIDMAKCIYSKVVDIGLKEKYHDNADNTFCLKIQSFIALAFLPLCDVINAFEELIDDDDLPQEFVSYFEIKYIGGQRGQGAKRRRVKPTFPIETWNVHHIAVQDMLLANNSTDAEGLGNDFQNSVTITHDDIWDLITALKGDENVAHPDESHLDPVNDIDADKKCEDLTNRLQTVVLWYDPRKKMDYLKAVISNFHTF